MWAQVGGCPYDEQVCSEEMGEKDKRNGSHAVERGRMHEAKEMRHRLIQVDRQPATQGHGKVWAHAASLGPWSHRSLGLY